MRLQQPARHWALGLIVPLLLQGPVRAGQFAESAALPPLAGVGVPTDPALVGAPYLDPARPLEVRVDDLLARLTPQEKASLLHGSGGFADYGGIGRIGLPRIVMTDGPQGVRAEVPTTALPSGIALAASWNTGLAERYGALLGRDAKATGHRVLLGPGVNLARTPLNGRNFEYFGEDPLLAGKIAAGYIRGVQSEGVAACIKHLVANDQESARLAASSELDERTLREFHLRPFEIAVREAGPWAVMPGYNRVRGVAAVDNAHVNRTLMREAAGSDAAFVSDWGAWDDGADAAALNGGTTLRMPFDADAKYDRGLLELVRRGQVAQPTLDEAVRRNLRLLFRVGAFDPAGAVPPRHAAGNAALARQAALEGAVLLKNDGATLPFDPARVKRVLVLGPNADRRFTMAQGGDELLKLGGSGATFPVQEITALAGLRERLGAQVIGYPWQLAGGKLDRDGLALAARAVDAVVFVGGIDFSFDHEGNSGERPDKTTLALPGPQAEVVKLLAAANPRTVAVLAGGSPMALGELAAAAPALLLQWYPGQEGGRALADLLFGDVSPSGKLPFTLGKRLADWRVHRLGAAAYPGLLFGKDGKPARKQPDLTRSQYFRGDVRVAYLEGPALGYRGFELDGIAPDFAFGHGLSYTRFDYSDARLSADGGAVTFTLRNAGPRAGAEVVQLYARPPGTAATVPENDRPLRGLVGFAKVRLEPGESRVVTLPFRAADLATWSDARRGWRSWPGAWTLEVAASSQDVRATVGFDQP
ncbi:beta-glucosidase [Chitinimonas koreensis]|uniref:beta-glucosidase n=1 Tax=Chitinimonas koreensis TaxID=356302 RepID=UPI000413F4CF|nr:glycoside hydrolase family 3 C-terminal domain-containing protein [Chitinimonas koreensis]QNM95708.1 glycoside hydrolase family 3 C-terminal domain-containing protein [Chitinimonas koreensis]